MRENLTAEPFSLLGKELRSLRNKACETFVETSAAVEISTGDLAKYELGKTRPSEETLLLLISHFKLRDRVALRLWKLAGYDNPSSDELPAIYTDSTEVNVGQLGVVVAFSQTGENSPVAKVGMSREHAQALLESLAVALEKTNKRRSISPDDEPR